MKTKKTRVNRVFDLANENIAKEKAKQKKYYDKNKREFSFKIGQKVLMKNHILSSAKDNRTKKFCPKKAGPYVIIQKIGDDIYALGEDGVRI